MRRVAAVAIEVAILCACASVAFAEGDGGDHGPGLLYPTINLLLLLAVLVYFGRKPIQQFFGDRRGEILDSIESAAKLHKQAETRYAEWQRKLANLEADLEDIRRSTRERAQAEGERILSDARANAERIRNDARTAVDQEVRRARLALREEAADLAVELAAERLRTQVGDSDRARLLDEFIERIESNDVESH